jgi:hypothetical protein
MQVALVADPLPVPAPEIAGQQTTALAVVLLDRQAGTHSGQTAPSGRLVGRLLRPVAFRDGERAPVGSDRGPSVAPLLKDAGVSRRLHPGKQLGRGGFVPGWAAVDIEFVGA